eukprot:7104543-Pyramimonas_sp.AAC.1
MLQTRGSNCLSILPPRTLTWPRPASTSACRVGRHASRKLAPVRRARGVTHGAAQILLALPCIGNASRCQAHRGASSCVLKGYGAQASHM